MLAGGSIGFLVGGGHRGVRRCGRLHGMGGSNGGHCYVMFAF